MIWFSVVVVMDLEVIGSSSNFTAAPVSNTYGNNASSFYGAPTQPVQQYTPSNATSNTYGNYNATSTTPYAASSNTYGNAGASAYGGYSTGSANSNNRPVMRDVDNGSDESNVIPISALNPYTNRYITYHRRLI
jgi:hypothetical protein